MKLLTSALIVLMLSGCGAIGTFKREARVSETEAVREVTDSGLFVTCASPFPMIQEHLVSPEKVAAWGIMCGYTFPQYRMEEVK